MNAALRDIEVRLRRACAEEAFGAAVAASREWTGDMAAPAAALPETAAMPTVLDVRGLVDPLADSALASPSPDPVPAKGAAREPPESRGRTASSFPRPRRRASIASRSADAGSQPASASLHKGTPSGSFQIESLLARYDRLGLGSRESGTVRVHGEPESPSARNVVPLSLRHPAGEAALRVEKARSSRAMASAIARWSALMADGIRERGEIAPRVDVVAERRQWSRQPHLSPDASYLTDAALDNATLASHVLADAEAIRPGVMLRLSDLTDPPVSPRLEPNPSQRPDPASQRAAMSGTGSADDLLGGGAAERGSLGRVFDSLARIEQQVAARASRAEPETQWYDDDDGLAGRIHDILRRQVERHGIDLP